VVFAEAIQHPGNMNLLEVQNISLQIIQLVPDFDGGENVSTSE
jgi:hypothetical protein